MRASFRFQEQGLSGSMSVPGDKSLSHRAVLFAAMSPGVSTIARALDSEDVRATVRAVEALGAKFILHHHQWGQYFLVIEGWGAAGPTSPSEPIDCGNSGTTARLLMGVLAGWPGVEATLVGDESLSKRPMRRVTEPLSAMGARFETTEAGTLPITVRGASLSPIDYASPVASAQVKTAVLLAGLRACGATRVSEPSLSRDHTERLLPVFGVEVAVDGAPGATVVGPVVPAGAEVVVPGDPSSAAFPAVAAAIVPGSSIELPLVDMNPTRTGFLRVFERMGADVRVTASKGACGDPTGTVSVTYVPGLRATTVSAEEVPTLVDEVPVLALLATQAAGTTRFEGVGELRVKESDRLAAIAEGLSALGATVRSGQDWLEVDGPTPLHGAQLDSLGDHRLAMTWALAGLIAGDQVLVSDFEAVDVSWRCFGHDMEQLGTALDEYFEDGDD